MRERPVVSCETGIRWRAHVSTGKLSINGSAGAPTDWRVRSRGPVNEPTEPSRPGSQVDGPSPGRAGQSRSGVGPVTIVSD